MNTNANASCSTNGSTCQISWGAFSRASSGVVWMILPVTTATTAIQNTQVSSRQIRNLDQSETRRRVSRSHPPKTSAVQNR